MRARFIAISGCLFVLLLFPLSLLAAEPQKAKLPRLPLGEIGSAPSGAEALCRELPLACATRTDHTLARVIDLPEIARLNRHINRRVSQISDQEQYGLPEKWTLPSSRGGDCEDIALLKKLTLIERGLAPRALLIATVLDRSNNPHAVLIYKSDGGDLVLDNLHDDIIDWSETGYSFLRIQDPADPSRWRQVLAGGIFKQEK